MKTPPISRKPGKLILCAVLFAVTAGAALLFALQAWLDGIVLERSMDAYAYVGTLTYDASAEENNSSGNVLREDVAFSLLDGEIISLIENSEYVTSADTRTTSAGLVEGIYTVPDKMITDGRLNQHYFIEATVIRMIDSAELPGLYYDFYTLRMEKQWGGGILTPGTLNLILYRSAEEEPLESGNRVFLIGDYYADGYGIRNDHTIIYTEKAAALFGEENAESILESNRVAVIPEGEDSEKWIMDYMEKTGLLPLFENYCKLENAVTVRRVSDMTMHPYFSSGRIFISEGRAIEPSDKGKKICIISQGLSNRNRLNVGDTIHLAAAEGCYTTSGLSSSENGWESGFPMEWEEILPYGEFEEYEIVGVFCQTSRKGSDPLFLGHNDIFVPSGEESAGSVRSYNFSFRVEGSGYEAFVSELGTVLDDNGYKIRLRDTGWEDVENTFFLLKDRRRFMLASAAAACALAAVLYAVLINRNCRKSYAISRILGGTKYESAFEYLVPFLAGGLSGIILAGITALGGYLLWMRGAMEEVLSVALPTTAECVRMLLLTAFAELALSALILAVLCVIQEQKGLLRLIRR